MSARRQRLQVAMFPFLSVLLCVLGSLILLMLVLDRKVKQATADHVYQERLAEREKRQQQRQAERQLLADERAREAEASRRAEEERVKKEQDEEMRQHLADLQARDEHRHQLQVEAEKLKAEEASQRQAVSRQEAELAALTDEVRRRQQQLGQLTDAARTNAVKVREAEQRKELAAKDRDSLQEQIRLLEQTVTQVVEANKKRPPLFYLFPPHQRVPGAGRAPIYLECVDRHVVFQPGNQRRSSDEIQSTTLFIEEIRRRQAAKGVAKKGEEPYLLLVIRPSGVMLYYLVVQLLQNTDIDMGYELIAEDWKLDFTDPQAQPPSEVAAFHNQAAAAEPPGPRGTAPKVFNRANLGAPIGTGPNAISGTTTGERAAHGGSVGGEAGNGTGAPSDQGIGGFRGNGSASGRGAVAGDASGRSPTGDGSGFDSPGSNGTPHGGATGPRPGQPRSSAGGGGSGSWLADGDGGASPAGGANATTSPAVGGYGMSGSVRGPAAGNLIGTNPASTGNINRGSGGAAGASGAHGEMTDTSQTPGDSSAGGDGNSGPSQPGGRPTMLPKSPLASGAGSPNSTARGSAGERSANDGPPQLNPNSQTAGTPGQPGTGTPGGGAESGQGRTLIASTAGRTSSGQGGAVNPFGASGGGGGGQADGPSDPMQMHPSSMTGPRPVNLGSEQPKQQAPRMVGGVERDWIIVIDCGGDGVSAPVRQERFTVEELARQDNPLFQSLERMIRQQLKRQPDIRPQLKYRIQTDGLRTYYRAAAALDALGLPSTTEKVPPPAKKIEPPKDQQKEGPHESSPPPR